MESQQQTNIGRYVVEKTLGRGSQGKVYLAFDPKLERRVAVKVLTSDKDEFNAKGANGTPLEALTASKLKHPSIIPIFDIGEADIGPYLVFGYVQGKTLALELGYRHHYSLQDAVPLIDTILGAMRAAHDGGVLHLDISPRNIMLDEQGKPQIMDFGLAQFANFHRADLSMATGTLRYMAPEHFLRQQLGPFTDVFALGATFYEMLTGNRSIEGATIDEMQRKIVAADIDYAPLAQLPHGDELVKFLKTAFQRDPKQRFANAGEMHDAFRLLATAASLGDHLRADDEAHSTVQFLIRRMQRKKDFPAISSTMSEINRLTSDEHAAPADKIANVILRDLSLTSKLLKMANSSFYGSRVTEVTSISQAIVVLGVERVRMVSSSLVLFGSMKNDSGLLRDSMTKSFFAGLIARHLARREKLKNAEEAFIAGMCQNLGENLAIYYFPEEHEDIELLRASEGMSRKAAAEEVLGVSFATLGASVARIWSLPEIIISTIQGLPDDTDLTPADDEEKIRNLSILANLLCDVFVSVPAEQTSDALDQIARHFAGTIRLEEGYLFKLFSAGFEKLTQFAPVFEINTATSRFCGAIATWLAARQAELDGTATATALPPAPAKASVRA